MGAETGARRLSKDGANMTRRSFFSWALAGVAACLGLRRRPETPIYRLARAYAYDDGPRVWYRENGDLEWFQFAQLHGSPRGFFEARLDGIRHSFIFNDLPIQAAS